MDTPKTRAARTRFTELYQRHYEPVLRFVGRRTTDTTRAEDVVQEAFTTAWRSLDKVPTQPDQERAYLFTTARNALLNERRGAARRGALAVRIADHASAEIPCHAEEVAAQLDLAEAFRGLAPLEQEVLALATWDAMPQTEAAQVLGINAAAYRKRLSRARASLRAALGHQNHQVKHPTNQKRSDYHGKTH